MAKFFLLLATVALLGLTQGQINQKGKPALLSIEQQQELLEQLAQLQRQTQQLLAAQQQLAAVAAAQGVQQQPSPSTSSSSSSSVLLSSPRSNNLQAAPKASKPAPKAKPTQPPQQTQPVPQGPQINWGKCPELEPSENEKLSKAAVITKCLENTPLPGNITRESVEQHREQIAACALRAEGWFNSVGSYDYSKAEKEIKNKRLAKDLELQVLSYHSQCKAESEEKYPASSNSIIAQIQLYQACMDYFISDVCGIEVNEPEAGQFN